MCGLPPIPSSSYFSLQASANLKLVERIEGPNHEMALPSLMLRTRNNFHRLSCLASDTKSMGTGIDENTHTNLLPNITEIEFVDLFHRFDCCPSSTAAAPGKIQVE